MIDGRYTIAELYLLLKMDIWRQGDVVGWGRVEKLSVDADGKTNKVYTGSVKSARNYVLSPLIKRHLTTGLYLLDLYLSEKNRETGENIYIAVIAVCRTTIEHLKSVFYLKISNKMDLTEFQDFVSENLFSKPYVRKATSRKPNTGRTFSGFLNS
jgi:hypothetical protein